MIFSIMSAAAINIILAGVCCLLLGYVAMVINHKRAHRRELIMRVSARAREDGWEIVPAILDAASSLNFMHLYAAIKDACKIFENDALRKATYDGFRKRMMTKALEDPETRASVYEMVDKQRAIDAIATDATIAKAETDKAAAKAKAEELINGTKPAG